MRNPASLLPARSPDGRAAQNLRGHTAGGHAPKAQVAKISSVKRAA